MAVPYLSPKHHALPRQQVCRLGRFGTMFRRVRAMLVGNPQSTSSASRAQWDELTKILARRLTLDVVETQYAGHAADVARRTTDAGVDLVLAHGGDGTVNEVVNGLLGEAGAEPCDTVPALGVIPGGSADVFAKLCGVPVDALDAAHHTLEALAQGRRKTIGLGKADHQWFTFNAGLGWDAEVVAEVERLRRKGHAATPALYARAAITCWGRGRRRDPSIIVEVDGEQPVDRLHTAVVSNVDPWTFIGSRPVRMNPSTTFASGLGFLALRGTHARALLRHVGRLLSTEAKPDGPDVFRRSDITRVHVRTTRPLHLQLDGDGCGERTDVEFTSVAHALHVIT